MQGYLHDELVDKKLNYYFIIMILNFLPFSNSAETVNFFLSLSNH